MNVEVTAVPELECAAAEATERGISVTPLFWTPKELANVAAITIKSNAGKVLFKGMLRVSGHTGKPTITARSAPVTPAVDRGKK
jgi:hypothetical protein